MKATFIFIFVPIERREMMKMEGEASSSSNERALPNRHGFIDTLFSWSLQDILNENLFKEKESRSMLLAIEVKQIPLSFQSDSQYFESFVFPLLEETRANLFSSLENISKAPFAQVVAFDESEPYGPMLYDVQVGYWSNRFSDLGKEPYKTLPGDILVLADDKPETASDLQRASRKIQIDGAKKLPFLIFLTNITTNKRIWNSLHMNGNSKIIKEILCTDSVVDENCELCSVQSEGIWTEIFGPSLSSTLNDSQVQAILSCLRHMHCDHKATVQLIWGPPGTGKTKTVSMLLVNLLQMKCRTLICAPTNVAIKELASRVVKLVKESVERDSRDPPFFPLGKILLFGNNERLKVDSGVEEIYLDYRIERLVECFAPHTSWKHYFGSMIDFLEHCVSQYHNFLDKWMKPSEDINGNMIEQKECWKEAEASKGEMPFHEFVRERFKCTAAPLRSCILNFGTHIPKCYIGEDNFQVMVTLMNLLDSFETLLFQDNVVSEELEVLFSHSVDEDFSQSILDIKYLLHKKRSECHFVLRNLRNSFNKLDLPRAMDKERLKDLVKGFCFKTASLFFSTASSSYMLHSMAMEPLVFLVIDEAAQLKESESTIPLQLSGIKHAVLFGDECQLPAMVESKVSGEACFGRSLFERLSRLRHSRLRHSKHLLPIQYRMHPSISLFPNSYFYDNKICDSPSVRKRSYEKRFFPGPMYGPYSFINVFGGREEFIEHSCRNMVEVSAVMKIMLNLYKAWIHSKEKLSIGIVSPYRAQVVAIQEKLGSKYEKSVGFAVKVMSIDGFQGGEEDIIIISTVRSNNGGSIGFISDPKRANVALTRARHCLWILGNERTLTRNKSVWKALVLDAKARKCFFNADDDKDLGKAILKVKKELDELDELLNPGSVLFRSQRWKVNFSDNFLKSFRKLTSKRTKNLVINLLLKLSSGWRPKKRNVDSVCASSLHIIKQFKVEGFYIICTIDIVKDVEESQYIQVLKVWDILTLEHVQKLVTRLDNIFVKYTDEYLNLCKEKCIEGNLEVPKTWAVNSNIVRFKNLAENECGCDLSGAASDSRNYAENSNVSDSLLLMKFYPLSSGVVSHLLSDRDGRELDLPFEVTDEQLEIILFPRSTFVLGRSGTGKTTILVMKLFQKEKHHYMVVEQFYGVNNSLTLHTSQELEIEEGLEKTERAILRQLFVTFVLESRNNGDRGRQEKGQLSDIFSLSQNFRTHVGVLNLAQSIMELLYRFFPHSVDILKPETSLIYGEPPILLESGDEENAILKIFGNSGEVGGHIVGFGAEQVILVRDDSVRKEISNYVGKQALVLTIIESKGLEFQDVLLYNFFGTSPLKNQWRVVYEYMKEQALLDSTSPRSFPSFNEAKHNVLCSELKQLYVAITRTRQSSNPLEANVYLREAAKIFEAIGKADSAAKCFYDLGEYERAGRIYMERCEKPELKNAGECFSLAGCYELAADVYARGNFFSECLAVCSKGKLFDIGLQYINYWKQQADTDVGLVGRSKDINKIEQDFLQSCALHYHGLNDNKSMMKFVKAFHSVDLMRNFLKSKSCFDELLVLEEESGNFMDAVKIAKLRGDILRTADLLQKAGNFKEACNLTLNYVLSNSLWSPGSKGWPLKQFTQKKELLDKAKSLAKNDSEQFYEFVCTEADILSDHQSDLLILNQQLNASKKHQSNSGETISVRKILNFHLKTNSSKYVWEDELVLDLKAHSEETICRNGVTVQTLVYFWDCWKDNIVNVLQYLGCLKSQHFNDFRSYGDFCLNYLGVWKQYNNLNTTYLLLNSDADWVRELDNKSGKLTSINVHQLVEAARSYWNSELLSVGMSVLGNLEALYKQSSKNSPSMSWQVPCLAYMYEVAKFLLSSKYLNLQYHAKGLHKFVDQSTEHFFDFIFPPDWRESMTKNMIFLRGTELYRNIIKEIIFKNIGLKINLSHRLIGSTVVMILGTGKLSNDVYERVARRFDGNSPWKEFVKSLSWNMGFESCQGSASYRNSDELEEFLYNEKEMMQWIQQSHTKNKQYHSLVVLRLVVIVCLLHLNFGNSVNLLVDLLGRNYISNKLPWEFCDALRRGRKRDVLNVIAEAFKKIGNPLVVASLGGNCPKFACTDAIFVDMRVTKCNEDILRTLFPVNEASQGHAAAARMEATNIQREELPTDSCELGKSSNVSSSGSTSLQDLGTNTLNVKVDDLLMNLGQFWKIFEAIEFGCFGIVFKDSATKEDVKKSIQLLTAAMDGCSQKSSFNGEDKNRWDEAASMLEDLKRLYAALDGVMSGQKHENVPTLQKIYNRLQSRRLEIEPFLNQLLQQYIIGKGKSSETGIVSAGECEVENTNSNADYDGNSDKGKMVSTSATSASEDQGISQKPENKRSGPSKSKKHKKGKRGRKH
ncbi:hypothetical protein CUMW_173100 [Citrus unshiu]|uniref:UvrD-like helicase ATP-binding domain-containing protein n=1 Tax=Citrus unshiu TaxID=55188 RepID=A0A2H5PW86_CITUN|nr:hypothetical protein CUMW_173100 [Citrus unshiu]